MGLALHLGNWKKMMNLLKKKKKKKSNDWRKTDLQVFCCAVLLVKRVIDVSKLCEWTDLKREVFIVFYWPKTWCEIFTTGGERATKILVESDKKSELIGKKVVLLVDWKCACGIILNVFCLLFVPSDHCNWKTVDVAFRLFQSFFVVYLGLPMGEWDEWMGNSLHESSLYSRLLALLWMLFYYWLVHCDCETRHNISMYFALRRVCF